MGDDGVPEVIFGVEPLVGVPGFAMVWLMATDAIGKDRKKQIQFLRACKPRLDEIQEEFPVVGNYVDARNELHLKWCKWLGFVELKRVPKWGTEDRPFVQIVRIRKDN